MPTKYLAHTGRADLTAQALRSRQMERQRQMIAARRAMMRPSLWFRIKTSVLIALGL